MLAGLVACTVALVALPSLPPLCPMRLVLHAPCPTCGMTRAVRLAVAGAWGEATRMHPLWLPTSLFVVAVAVAELAGRQREGAWGKAAEIAWLRRAGYALAFLLLGVWVARFGGALGGPAPLDG